MKWNTKKDIDKDRIEWYKEMISNLRKRDREAKRRRDRQRDRQRDRESEQTERQRKWTDRETDRKSDREENEGDKGRQKFKTLKNKQYQTKSFFLKHWCFSTFRFVDVFLQH